MFVASDAMDFNYGSTWNLSRRGILNGKVTSQASLILKQKLFLIKKYFKFCQKIHYFFRERKEAY